MSVDGSKFDADASKHRSVTYERAGQPVDHLELEIADLMGRTEAARGPGEEDPQALSKEIARRKALRDRLVAAPETALADNGHADGDEVERLAETGIEALVALACNCKRLHRLKLEMAS